MNSSILFGIIVGGGAGLEILDIQELSSLTSMYDGIRDMVSLCWIGSLLML